MILLVVSIISNLCVSSEIATHIPERIPSNLSICDSSNSRISLQIKPSSIAKANIGCFILLASLQNSGSQKTL